MSSTKSLRHKFQSAIADDAGNPQRVRPSSWNDDHDFLVGINQLTGTSYDVDNDDAWTVVDFSATSTKAATLPQAGVDDMFESGWFSLFKNTGAGDLVITPVGCQIDSTTNLTLPTGYGAWIWSDGAAYHSLVCAPSSLLLDGDLSALVGLGGTGFATRTGTNTWAQRSLQAPAAGLTITNPAGIAGDPTFALANDLAALEGLTGAGFPERTGTDTWTTTSFSGSGAVIRQTSPTLTTPTLTTATLTTPTITTPTINGQASINVTGLTKGFNISHSSVTGTQAGELYYNLITVGAAAGPFDAATSTGPSNNALAVVHYIGGSTMTGGRAAFSSLVYMKQKTSSTVVPGAHLREYAGAQLVAKAEDNDGGTVSVPLGALYGFNAFCQIDPTATYWLSATGGEIDITVRGTDPLKAPLSVSGLSIAPTALHQLSGKVFDSVLSLVGTINDAGGMNHGILFNRHSGAMPVKTTGNLISVLDWDYSGTSHVTPTFNFGVYLDEAAFTTAAFSSPRFRVDGNGNTSVRELLVGLNGTNAGAATFYGLTSGGVTVKPGAAAAGTYNFNLPIDAGTSGYALVSGGGGSAPMTWVSIAGSTVPTGGLTGQLLSAVTSSSPAWSSQPQLGINGTIEGQLGFRGSTSGQVTVRAGAAAAGTYYFNLPIDAGTSGQALLSGGGGSTAMSFGTLGAGAGGTGIASPTIHKLLVGNGSSAMTQLAVGLTGQILTGVDTSDPAWSSQPQLGINGTIEGILGFRGATSGQVIIRTGAAAAGSYNFYLPITVGLANQVLTSQAGASAMTWTTLATVATSGSAADLTGTLASARLSGSYTGITAVGTIATGTWNATVIGTTYGGFGQSMAAASGVATWNSGTLTFFDPNAAGGYIPYGNTTHGLTQSASLIFSGTALGVGGATSGNVGSVATFAQSADTQTGVVITRTAASSYELWLGVNNATGYASIQAAQAGVGANKSLLLNPNGGSVNIGTSTAGGAPLHVELASGITTVRIKSNNGGGNFGGALEFYDGATSSAGFVSVASGELRTYILGAEKTRLTSNGVLGIGATTTLDASATHKLEVGDGTTAKYIRINGGNSANQGAGVFFSAAGTSGTANYTGYVGNYSAYAGGGSTDFSMLLLATNDVRFQAGSASMILKSTGLVGIGMTPTAMLTLNAGTNDGIRLDNGTVKGIMYNGGGNTLILGTVSAHPTLFYTNNAEVARITSAGEFLIGRTTTASVGKVELEFSGFAYNGMVFNDTYASNATTKSIWFKRVVGSTSTDAGSITTTISGGVLGATAYNTTSDQRRKDDLRSFGRSGEIIDALQIWDFRWKGSQDHRGIGVMAQEAHKVFPDMIYKPDNDNDTWGADYSKLVPVLTAEVKTLRTRIADLEARLAA